MGPHRQKHSEITLACEVRDIAYGANWSARHDRATTPLTDQALKLPTNKSGICH